MPTQDQKFEAQLHEHQLKELAVSRANADPLPGPLGEAFGNDSILVESTTGDKIQVRKAVFTDFILLKKLNSPLYKQVLEAAKPKEIREETPFEQEDGLEMAYQFTRPAKEARVTLAKGREAFREAAMELGDKYDTVTIERIVRAVELQLSRNFETAVKYAPAEEEGEKERFFPVAAASPTKEADGASITAGGS